MKVVISKPVRITCHPDGCEHCSHRRFCPENEQKQQVLDEDYIEDKFFVS